MSRAALTATAGASDPSPAMIQSVSISISEAWAESGVISGDEAESYRYGLELLISTALNLLAIVCISIVLGHPLMFIPYLAVFIPMRLFAGGYHAGRHWICILFNAFVYFAALFTMPLMSDYASAVFCVAVSVTALVLVFLYAPVEAKNKPLYDSERVRSRRISLALAAALLAASLVLCFTGVLPLPLCRMLFCGEAAAMVLLVMEKVSGAVK